jgi:hypothetical protein
MIIRALINPNAVVAEGKDDGGCIRRDESDRCWNLFIVADNLQEGAATMQMQIAEHLIVKKANSQKDVGTLTHFHSLMNCINVNSSQELVVQEKSSLSIRCWLLSCSTGQREQVEL